MASIFVDFHEAQRRGDGRLLASCLAPIGIPQDPGRLKAFAQLSNHQTISADIRYHVIQDRSSVKLPKNEGNAWVDIFVAYWKCIKEIVALEQSQGGSWSKAYDAYREVCSQLIRGYSSNGFQAWTVPCLQTTGKYLRIVAMKADVEGRKNDPNGAIFSQGFSDDIMGSSESNEKLEGAAWIINRMFTTCLSDRSDLSESRKWAIYGVTNLLFKVYFQLNSISLTKNVIRALDAAGDDLPDLSLFPKSHQCTFAYYRGVIAFLQEAYSEAESYFNRALSLCLATSFRNREQILIYLVPVQMLVHHKLLSATLLAPHPSLSALFSPLCKAIRTGSLMDFDIALADNEPEFIRRRIYLTLERTRDVCLRNLFRKVFLAAGWEESKDGNTGEVTGKIRRTRIRIEEFEAGMRIGLKGNSGQTGASRAVDSIPPVMVDRDEVECFLANMIYKNLMKGYIARDRGIVVLSKGGAFPGTGV